VSESFEISGTGTRQNPLRRALEKPFSGEQLFVKFRIVYPAKSVDTPENGDGEFFVMWVDKTEGNDASTHSGNIPNVGIHVKDVKENRFMVRYAAQKEAYGPKLEPDREFLIVARLWKPVPGPDKPFDKLDLWVDPKLADEKKPQASVSSTGSLAEVKWLGFSTGRKTEATDRIRVSGIGWSDSWRGIFGIPNYEIPESVKKKRPEPKPLKLAKVDPPPAEITSDHWAFQTIRRPDAPDKNAIDFFIGKQHKILGLTPAPPADDTSLRRRISLVLTGLPDREGSVEELLKSREFGERWGRHWLDVARWAESNGHQHNRDRPHAWKYRDYVVRSFQNDKPFDQFVREQIAGDELPKFDPDHLIATGFLAAARYSGNELDKKIQRNDILVDITNTTSEAFLGLTIACAQCHDHFFDPVTAWDYYQMQAFFAKGQPGNVVLEPGVREVVHERWKLFEFVRHRKAEELRKRGTPEPVLVIPKTVISSMKPEEKRHFTQLENEIAKFDQTWAFYSPVTSPHGLEFAPHEMRWPLYRDLETLKNQRVHYLVRGDIGSPGPEVKPAWPQVFGPTDYIGDRPRLALANWITSPENPLAARVWVNRIWQGYFGRGLVETSGNFGLEGSEPSHPELLDFLASELVDSGWSSRHIHRLILESATFRRSSEFSAANHDRDPDNLGLWRWKPRRLESEAIRDSILAIAGRLDLSMPGGPSDADAKSSRRRSIYLRQKRDKLPHQQMLFDSPNAVTSCAKRRTSTVSLQPLWLLNSNFIQQNAAALAKRMPEKDGAEFLIKTVFKRAAETEEIEKVEELIAKSGATDAAAALLNANEFLYIP
ncbi:MAG: DUF1553 domain-containing protein, partial [Verrucomicrobiales bacterium]|nr:DUF1553 domain-containing protein [Verrucomicrobiales bacterium]